MSTRPLIVLLTIAPLVFSCSRKPAALTPTANTPAPSVATLLPDSTMQPKVIVLIDIAIRGKPSEQVKALNELSSWRLDVPAVAPLIRTLLESPSAAVAAAAANALRNMGPEAVPELIEELRSPNDRARMIAAQSLGDPIELTRLNGPESDIIAALTPVLDDPSPNVIRFAARALCAWGVDAHPPLIDAMKRGNTLVENEVVEQLLTRLRDFTEAVRPTTIFSQAQIDNYEFELARWVAPALMRRAVSGADDVRLKVAAALGCLPPRAVGSEASPSIDIPKPPVGPVAVTAKVANSIAELEGLPYLIKESESKDALSRAAAITALLTLPEGKTDARVVKVTLNALSDSDETIRSAAFRWLMSVPNPSAEVLRKIAEIVTSSAEPNGGSGRISPDDADRISAIKLLDRFRSEPDAAVKAFGASLSTASHEVRMAAIHALCEYREKAAPALSQMQALVSAHPEWDSELNAAAATMLKCGREGRKAATWYYIHRLGNSNEDDFYEALRAIALIGPDAVPLLRNRLADEDNSLRIRVVDALAEIGPAASPAVPALVRMMDNPNFGVRQGVSAALVKISPEGKGLGPALIAAVYNDDDAAAERLLPVFRRADDTSKTVARINDLAADDDVHVRATARHVLQIMATDPTTQPANGGSK